MRIEEDYLNKVYLFREDYHCYPADYCPFNQTIFWKKKVIGNYLDNSKIVLELEEQHDTSWNSSELPHKSVITLEKFLQDRLDNWIIPFKKDIMLIKEEYKIYITTGKILSVTEKSYLNSKVRYITVLDYNTSAEKEYRSYQVVWPRHKWEIKENDKI